MRKKRDGLGTDQITKLWIVTRQSGDRIFVKALSPLKRRQTSD